MRAIDSSRAAQGVRPEAFMIGYLRAEDEQRKLCFKRLQDTEHLLSGREVKFGRRLHRPQR